MLNENNTHYKHVAQQDLNGHPSHDANQGKMKRVDEMDYDDIARENKISPFTMAVIPNTDPITGDIHSTVLDLTKDKIESRYKPTDLIDIGCRFFGSSLQGCIEGSRAITSFVQKNPIAIESTAKMYFFPTISPSHAKCYWINHTHVEESRRLGEKEIEVLFTNGTRLIIHMSIQAFTNQLHRTAQFRYFLENRINRSFKSEYDMQLGVYNNYLAKKRIELQVNNFI